MAEIDALDLMAEIAAWAKVRGAVKLNARPGIWEEKLDECWRVAINAHPGAAKTAEGWEVPAYSFAVFFHGWLWCIVNAGGGFALADEAANLDMFRAALQLALDRKETPDG